MTALLAVGALAACAPAVPGGRVGTEAGAASASCDERELVVLVHGMGRTPLSMLPLAVMLRHQGYEVLNFGYSSFGPSVEEIATRLAASMRTARGDDASLRVHFVGHSLGNIVIRWMLENERPEGVGRVVMLAPPNQGSSLADRLDPALSWLLAPLPELTTDPLSTVRRLPPPKSVEFAIVVGDRDGKVSVAEAFLPGAVEQRVVPGHHTFIMMRPSILEMVGRFLRTGTLGTSGGVGPLPCLGSQPAPGSSPQAS